jgi:hypothetical protein
MPLNRNDVEMLNASMRGVGDAFRTARLDAEAKQRAMDEAAIRKTMADNTKQHQTNTEKNYSDRTKAIEGVAKAKKDAADAQAKMKEANERVFGAIAFDVKNKKMTRAQAAEAAKDHFWNISGQNPDEFSKLESDPRFAPLMSPDFAWESIGGKQLGEMKTATIADTEKEFELEEAAKSGDPADIRKLEIFKANKAIKSPLVKPPTDPKSAKIDFFEKGAMKAELDGDDATKLRAETALSKLGPQGVGEMRRRDEELMRSSPPSLGRLPPPPASAVAAPQTGTNAPAASPPQGKLEPGQYLKRKDGKIRVKNAAGVKGWATVDPNNLPDGYTLSD